jgi:hypothetical protein
LPYSSRILGHYRRHPDVLCPHLNTKILIFTKEEP